MYPHVTLAGCELSASRPCSFTSRKRTSCTHWIGSWVDPRTVLDHMQKWKFMTLPALELQPLSRPASSQLLYRLRYRDSPGFHCSTQLIFTRAHSNKSSQSAVITSRCLVAASNGANPSASVITASRFRWLSPVSLQVPSQTNRLPTAGHHSSVSIMTIT
jgi:hypothetical protein